MLSKIIIVVFDAYIEAKASAKNFTDNKKEIF